MGGHLALAPLAAAVRWHDDHAGNLCPPSGWAVVTSVGTVHLNPGRHGTPVEWAWVAAHCLIHLGFGHTGWRGDRDPAWNLACCLTANRFVDHLGVGQPPPGIAIATRYDEIAETTRGEESCADRLRELGTDLVLHTSGTGGHDGVLRWTSAVEPKEPAANGQADWAELLAAGLARVAGEAVDKAGGVKRALKTEWQLALDWFVASHPLLGAIADAFTLVEDADVCRAHGIRIAAISPVAAELYVNPLYGLTSGERRFVIAHELLHAGLRHDTKAGWRDPWLWNVATLSVPSSVCCTAVAWVILLPATVILTCMGPRRVVTDGPVLVRVHEAAAVFVVVGDAPVGVAGAGAAGAGAAGGGECTLNETSKATPTAVAPRTRTVRSMGLPQGD